jgi:hypothetical protein
MVKVVVTVIVWLRGSNMGRMTENAALDVIGHICDTELGNMSRTSTPKTHIRKIRKRWRGPLLMHGIYESCSVLDIYYQTGLTFIAIA